MLTVFVVAPDIAITTRRRVTLSANVSIFIQTYQFRHNRGSNMDFFLCFFSRTSRYQLLRFDLHLLILQRYPISTCSDELQLLCQLAFARSSASVFSIVSGMFFFEFQIFCASYHMTSDPTILFAITSLLSHFLPLYTIESSQLAITQT